MAVVPVPEGSPRIQEAKKLSKTDASKAEAIYKDILIQKVGNTAAALQEYEAALISLGESYRDTNKVNELAELVKSSTSSLSSFTKAKTAKLGTYHSSTILQGDTTNASPQSANSSTSSPLTNHPPSPSKSLPQNPA